MLSIPFKLFLLASCLMTGQANAKGSEKLDVLLLVNAVTSDLLVIAAKRQSLGGQAMQQSRRDEIQRLINKQESLAVLARLSASSRAYMYPGRAQDQAVDNVLDEAWHASIRRIEQIGGQAAILTLQDIALEQHLDGAYSLSLEAALKRLKAKTR